MSCILYQQTLPRALDNQRERGKTLLYSHKEASGGWQKRTRKLPCCTRCAFRHKNAEAFLNKGGKGNRTGVSRRHLLKAGCNTGGIGYVRKSNRLIALSISSFPFRVFFEREVTRVSKL